MYTVIYSKSICLLAGSRVFASAREYILIHEPRSFVRRNIHSLLAHPPLNCAHGFSFPSSVHLHFDCRESETARVTLIKNSCGFDSKYTS